MIMLVLSDTWTLESTKEYDTVRVFAMHQVHRENKEQHDRASAVMPFSSISDSETEKRQCNKANMLRHEDIYFF